MSAALLSNKAYFRLSSLNFKNSDDIVNYNNDKTIEIINEKINNIVLDTDKVDSLQDTVNDIIEDTNNIKKDIIELNKNSVNIDILKQIYRENLVEVLS